MCRFIRKMVRKKVHKMFHKLYHEMVHGKVHEMVHGKIHVLLTQKEAHGPVHYGASRSRMDMDCIINLARRPTRVRRRMRG